MFPGDIPKHVPTRPKKWGISRGNTGREVPKHFPNISHSCSQTVPGENFWELFGKSPVGAVTAVMRQSPSKTKEDYPQSRIRTNIIMNMNNEHLSNSTAAQDRQRVIAGCSTIRGQSA